MKRNPSMSEVHLNFGNTPTSSASSSGANAFMAMPSGGGGGGTNNNSSSGAAAMEQIAPFAFNYVVDQSRTYMTNEITKNVGRYRSYLEGLKFYFTINNSYVFSKLKILLLPFRHKKWSRKLAPSGDSYLPPSEDVNCPDLYIPLMAFTTWVLLVGFLLGIEDRFTPDLLGSLLIRGFIFLLIEVGLIKLGFYLLSVPNNLPFLDVLANSGYKFFGIVLCTLASLAPWRAVFYIAVIVLGLNMAIFMIKTLRHAFIDPETVAVAGPQRIRIDQHTNKRNYFLFLVAVMQIPYFWWVSSRV